MGDAENSLPSSKKRAAGRELTRDTPLDDEEDSPELDAGTFKRASDEVLASRRIVKVRRQHTNSAPASNPFAGIRLVAPTESNANPGEVTAETQEAGENTVADYSKGSDSITKESEKAKDEEGKQSETESKTHEVEDKCAGNKDAAEGINADKENNGDKSEVDVEQRKDGNKSENDDKKDAADKETANEVDKEQIKDENTENYDKNNNGENKDKKDDKVESEEPSAEGGTLKSFQQLSQSQNAFTGLAGTGFSSSLFSFGSMSNDGSALGSGSGSIFGMKNDKPLGLGLSNNGSSGFGAAVSKSDGSGFSTLQEVVIETGEENEKVVFNADSVLFEFVDGSWKERGKGEVKVNVTSGTEKARLLMRSRGNYRLILNARLYPDMKLTNMDKKGVTFACINSATEGKDGLSTFALKFKDGSIVEEFKAAITAHKGETSTVLKIAENCPEASDV
ncbi:nuclear pore complex protein NUP50A-like [Abrus precatorius]|uniref:Nuclear pore complex protein NUP50A-like n=1 Tax=Abrus precatorius TaxID=3816 RepID=A0A8B8KMX4_ABRPR|nr:nuclear pore complex protein NUP50A-like [Abrus precatorius]XP_027344663.1 nuclear pore complex protein NUP50A-like [Abrus precatorius]